MTLFLHTANDYYLRAFGAWLEPDVITDPNGLAGDTGVFSNMRLLVKVRNAARRVGEPSPPCGVGAVRLKKRA